MQPSSAFCRTQQAIHNDRAEKAQLDNVRIVAERAANAWNQEALLAERREERSQRTRSLAAACTADEMVVGDDEDESDEETFSENPDRGLASV